MAQTLGKRRRGATTSYINYGKRKSVVRRRRYRPKRRTRRPRYRARKSKRSIINPTLNRLITPAGVPLRQAFVKFNYDACVRFVLGEAAQAFDWDYIRANGLYDPYVFVGGSRPKGYGLFTGLFTTYTVVAAKITVTFINESQYPRIGCLHIADSYNSRLTSSSYNLATLVERNDTKVVHVGGIGSPNYKRTVSMYVNIPKLMDMDKEDDALAGNYSNPGTLPSSTPTFSIGMGNTPTALPSGTPAGCYFSLRVKYYTRLHGAIELQQLG